MDLKERRSALVLQHQQTAQAIQQAVEQMKRYEGAIAILDEQIAELPAEPDAAEQQKR